MKEDNSHYLLGEGKTDEAHIEQLIRLGGKRDEIDPACRARVRQQLLLLWAQQHQDPALVSENQKQKSSTKKTAWFQSWALAAGVLSLCIAIVFFNKKDSHEIIATVNHVHGDIYLHNVLLKNGDIFYTGQEINTHHAMLEVKWQNGGIIKFDQNTQVSFVSKEEVRLNAGALYFDSNDSSHIRIHTSRGVVSDIGTEFETRSESQDLVVRVREGKVKIARPEGESLFIQSGKFLHVSNGNTLISDINPNEQPWLWADAMDGNASFDNHTMADVLTWLAKRENWQLQFNTDLDKKYAQKEMLHGQFNTANSRELLEQLSLISDMRYQVINNILLVTYP